MRKSPLYFRSIVAAFIGLAMSLFSVSAFASVDQFKPGGVAVAAIVVKALPNNDGYAPEFMEVTAASRVQHDTSAEIIESIRARVEWLVANPVVAQGVDPALPYKDLLMLLGELKLERGKQVSARQVSALKMYRISADRGDAVRRWIEGVRA